MRSIEEIRARQEQFYKELALDETDEQVEAIIDTLNWVLGESNELDNYLSE